MLPTTLAVALTIGLLAAAPAPPAPEYPLSGGGTSRDFDKPPPGSAADQALWQSSYDMNNELVLVQHTASRLQLRTRANLERLADPASRGKVSKEDAEKLAQLLTEKLTASAQLMVSPWPVSKQRVCRYELLNLEGVMLGGASAASEKQLEDTRRDLNGCMARASAVLGEVRKSNDALVAANGDAERALGPPVAKAAAAAGTQK